MFHDWEVPEGKIEMFLGSLWAQYEGGLFWHDEQNIVANNVLRGTNRSRYASNVHLVLSFHLHVCLLVQPNYANKGEEDSLLQIMTLKGVYCSRQTVLALRRQGWSPTLIVDWVYERSIVLVHMDNMEKYGYDVDVDVVRQNLQEFFSYSDHYYTCALSTFMIQLCHTVYISQLPSTAAKRQR